MTTTVEQDERSGGRGGSAWPIVDCDVHEMLPAWSRLTPYLDPVWQQYIGQWSPYFFGYAYPTEQGFARADSIPEAGPAGSDYELMRSQLLDEFDVAIAVLTGLFFPSDNGVQPELSNALVSAYNDWVRDEWLARDPRLRASLCVNVHDPAAAVEEIRRVGKRERVVQVMLPPLTEGGYGHKRYLPILEAAVEEGLLVALHPSARIHTALGYPPRLIEWRTVGPVQHAMSQVTSIVCSGAFERWPDLRVTIVEGGWSWIPHLMWRLDQNYRQLRQEVPWLRRLPSDYIRTNMRFTTQPVEEMPRAHMLQVIEQMGSDELLLFSSDYPHFDFDSPYRALKKLPSSLLRKIQFENPATWYGFGGELSHGG